MILNNFYTQKKAAILNEFNSSPSIAVSVHLYSDRVFKNTIANPIVMFKYDSINWESSSEKTYKADVSFCCYIVLPISYDIASDSYKEAFTIADRIDKAILSNNPGADFIDANSTFKVQEKQSTNDNEYWDKNEYFVWKITYKTTLIENALKKKYILIDNGFTPQEIIKLGYNPNTDFIETYNKEISGNLYVNTNPAGQTETSIVTDTDIDNDGTIDTNDTVIATSASHVYVKDVNNNSDIAAREIKTVKIN